MRKGAAEQDYSENLNRESRTETNQTGSEEPRGCKQTLYRGPQFLL